MTTGNGRRPATKGLWWAVLTAALALPIAPVAAQPATPPPDPTGQPPQADDRAAQARQLYEQGVAAMSEQQWARAETLFEQAYDLKRHYQISGNLGTCELELGKYAEAAGHLHQALTELDEEGSQGRERVALKKLLTTARAQCGTLEIRIEPAGQRDLEVTVDGQRLDWPQRQVFVAPGRHQITARAPTSQGQVERSVDVEIGVTHKVALQLDASPSAPVAPGPDEPSDPAALPSYPIWIGIGATAAAAGAGIALRVVAAGAESDADQLRDDIRAGQASCAADCPELIDRYGDADGAYDASTGLFIAAGALAAATVGYAVLIWTDDSEPATSARLSVHPLAGGLGLTLDFQ